MLQEKKALFCAHSFCGLLMISPRMKISQDGAPKENMHFLLVIKIRAVYGYRMVKKKKLLFGSSPLVRCKTPLPKRCEVLCSINGVHDIRNASRV